MSYGLQLWDSAGNLSLDTTSRLTRYVASFSGTIDARDYSHPNPYMLMQLNIGVSGIANDGTWGVMLTGVGTHHSSETVAPSAGNYPWATIGSGVVTINWWGWYATANNTWETLAYSLIVYRF